LRGAKAIHDKADLNFLPIQNLLESGGQLVSDCRRVGFGSTGQAPRNQPETLVVVGVFETKWA
jgi:hypothetical protein